MNFNFANIKKVAFPHEHGAWGFFLEPITLALIISFTFDGLLIGICSFLLFLANQPSSYIIKQNPKYLLGLSYTFLILYLILAFFILTYVIIVNNSNKFLIPFFCAIILMFGFKIFESRNFNRKIFVELIPQFAVTLIAISILLKNNWEAEYIVGFFILVLARSVQTVYYINNKLKIIKGYKPNRFLVNFIGGSFLIIISFLSFKDFLPVISLVAVIMLILRAYLGLMEKYKNEKVKIIGIKEFIYGFLFVIVNSIGYLNRI